MKKFRTWLDDDSRWAREVESIFYIVPLCAALGLGMWAVGALKRHAPNTLLVPVILAAMVIYYVANIFITRQIDRRHRRLATIPAGRRIQ